MRINSGNTPNDVFVGGDDATPIDVPTTGSILNLLPFRPNGSDQFRPDACGPGVRLALDKELSNPLYQQLDRFGIILCEWLTRSARMQVD